MQEMKAKFWIAERLESGREIPQDLKAQSFHGVYQLVMGYREKKHVLRDILELTKKSPDSPLVMLQFDERTRLYEVLQMNESTETVSI
jgi:hypothetical protein